MSRRLTLNPEGWPLPFAECPPGFFVVLDGGAACFKSEYGGDAYCESGEAFWGPAPQTKESRAACVVQPVVPVWEEVEDV